MSLHSLELVTDTRIHLTKAFFIELLALFLEVGDGGFDNLIVHQEIVAGVLRRLLKVKEETRIFSNLSDGPFYGILINGLISSVCNRYV